jgi:hypothetical protein
MRWSHYLIASQLLDDIPSVPFLIPVPSIKNFRVFLSNYFVIARIAGVCN